MLKFFWMILIFGLPGCSSQKINTVKNTGYAFIGEVSVAGNSWRTPAGTEGGEITKEGIKNWTDKNVDFVTYVRLAHAGSLILSLKAGLPDGNSLLLISIADKSKRVSLSGSELKLYDAGKWDIMDSGYVAISIKGLTKTGTEFATITGLQISGTAVDEGTSYVKNDEGNFFYWGRRGPSVHLNYDLPKDENVEYFYNEIIVPKGNDVIGSYFMAIGFGEGYFGIQVNSASERRVLFSVWSPFKTDNPKEIPEEEKIQLLRKGKDVYSGEFGNEGSGGQSFLRYDWKPDVSYKFLLKGNPENDGHTTYTAWFFAPEENNWKLIASFCRPKTNTWLKRFHSFLENFDPEQGDKIRKVFFNNQWVYTNNKEWIEITKATFTADNTARVGFRKDYAGGLMNNSFYLQNCGFFKNNTAINSQFKRPALNYKPNIDFDKLP